jgi:hypothetical protein
VQQTSPSQPIPLPQLVPQRPAQWRPALEAESPAYTYILLPLIVVWAVRGEGSATATFADVPCVTMVLILVGAAHAAREKTALVELLVLISGWTMKCTANSFFLSQLNPSFQGL